MHRAGSRDSLSSLAPVRGLSPSSTSSTIPKVVVESYLVKRGGGTSMFGRQTLRRRYVVLTDDGELSYYKSRKTFIDGDLPLKPPCTMRGCWVTLNGTKGRRRVDSAPTSGPVPTTRGARNLIAAPPVDTSVPEPVDERLKSGSEFWFNVQTPDKARVWEFSAATEAERTAWMTGLSQIQITLSVGNRLSLKSPVGAPDPSEDASAGPGNKRKLLQRMSSLMTIHSRRPSASASQELKRAGLLDIWTEAARWRRVWAALGGGCLNCFVDEYEERLVWSVRLRSAFVRPLPQHNDRFEVVILGKTGGFCEQEPETQLSNSGGVAAKVSFFSKFTKAPLRAKLTQAPTAPQNYSYRNGEVVSTYTFRVGRGKGERDSWLSDIQTVSMSSGGASHDPSPTAVESAAKAIAASVASGVVPGSGSALSADNPAVAAKLAELRKAKAKAEREKDAKRRTQDFLAALDDAKTQGWEALQSCGSDVSAATAVINKLVSYLNDCHWETAVVAGEALFALCDGIICDMPPTSATQALLAPPAVLPSVQFDIVSAFLASDAIAIFVTQLVHAQPWRAFGVTTGRNEAILTSSALASLLGVDESGEKSKRKSTASAARTVRRLQAYVLFGCVTSLHRLVEARPLDALAKLAKLDDSIVSVLSALLPLYPKMLTVISAFLSSLASAYIVEPSSRLVQPSTLIPAMVTVGMDLLTGLWRQLHEHFRSLDRHSRASIAAGTIPQGGCSGIRFVRSGHVSGCLDELGFEPALGVVPPCPLMISYGHSENWQGSGRTFLKGKRYGKRVAVLSVYPDVKSGSSTSLSANSSLTSSPLPPATPRVSVPGTPRSRIGSFVLDDSTSPPSQQLQPANLFGRMVERRRLARLLFPVEAGAITTSSLEQRPRSTSTTVAGSRSAASTGSKLAKQSSGRGLISSFSDKKPDVSSPSVVAVQNPVVAVLSSAESALRHTATPPKVAPPIVPILPPPPPPITVPVPGVTAVSAVMTARTDRVSKLQVRTEVTPNESLLRRSSARKGVLLHIVPSASAAHDDALMRLLRSAAALLKISGGNPADIALLLCRSGGVAFLLQVLRLSESRHLPPVAVDAMFSCFASLFALAPDAPELDAAVAPLRDVLSTMLLVHFVSATRTTGGNTPRRIDVPSSVYVEATGQSSRIGSCLELYRLLCTRDVDAPGYAAAREGAASFSHYLGTAMDAVCGAEFKTLSPAEWDVVARAMQSCVLGGRNCVWRGMNNFSPSQRRQSRPSSLASSSGPSTGRSLSITIPSTDGRGTAPSFAETEDFGEDGTLFERDDEDDFDENEDMGEDDDGSDADEFVSSVDSPHMMPAPANRVPAGSIDRVDSLYVMKTAPQKLPPPPPPPADNGLIDAIRRSSSAVGKSTYSGVLVWKDVHGGWIQHPVCVEDGVLCVYAMEGGESVPKHQVKCAGLSVRVFDMKPVFKRPQFHVEATHASIASPLAFYTESGPDRDAFVVALQASGALLRA